MSNDIPNFNLLAVFSAVMEQGSLSKAATQLGTNQSTISTSLSRLKKDVGQELFVRKGRGVVPTSYSQMLYKQIKEPIEQLNGVFSSMADFDPQSSHRKFSLSSPEHLQWMLLNHFGSLPNPNLQLAVHDQDDDDDSIYEDLLSSKYDAMIDILVPEHPSIESVQLLESDVVVICREGHPRIQDKITQEQFLQEKHAVLERRRRKARSLEHYTSLDLSQREIVFRGRSLFSSMLLVSRSDYITALPISLALQFQKQLNLQLLKPPFEYQPIAHYLIWLKRQTADPAHSWFRDQVLGSSHKLSDITNDKPLVF
ncbi:LysR family transcriptional regulator [Vibrio fortis]|uniref:LysR family transcriptional regulator n=1 Tax=Vibrio fortis TaxID=212667 RepID=A0A5N3QWV2_9VIBR|nr:LysR family transcriptional regulator [Vibrio fortis]KAB0286603.1 LysR family transcriptional regulator [Vibrio fortis]